MKFNFRKYFYIALTIIGTLNYICSFPLINFDDGPDFISEGVGKVVLFLKNPNKPFEDVGERLGGLAKSGLDIADDVLKAYNPHEIILEPGKASRILNPVFGEIQTISRIADTVVQLGQQILPGLIANVTLNSGDLNNLKRFSLPNVQENPRLENHDSNEFGSGDDS